MSEIELLFENSDFVIVDKPAGLNFHSEEEAGLVVLTAKLLHVKQLYSVHRLDKMTSGLLILAKTKEAAQIFTKLFESHQIEKYYIAISLRKPKKKQGWIKGDMISARRGNYMFAKTSNNPAITQFISKPLRPNERFFLIKPHTGKTHQIRVALKSIAAPIAGDIRYANADDAKKETRGYLHAFALRFNFKDKEYSFTCKPNEGERFLSLTCKEVLEYYASAWDYF
ncbi:MAG: TIGR01621 family pseudouridine synthase [Campylobacterota bacterium]|nr:TIGR01621 family pseudouridine synthase [Campylobacterota bacterium]